MTREIVINTPGRLHFGLTSLGGEGRQFGGLGLMVDGVGVSLRIIEADAFVATGPLSDRVHAFARAFASFHQLAALPCCQVEILASPPDHVGLGVGTQLGLAVIAGLAEWMKIEWREATLLSQMSGRGKRSAIGTHGFLQGGLLVDAGKLPDEPVGQLADRVELPAAWRIVLIRPPAVHGLAGSAETKAMSTLPIVPSKVSESLVHMINKQILPAARAADWQLFGEAIYDYGHLAGECFAAVQGGPFASPETARLVAHLRELGIPGVGQSSWGPTVFAIVADQTSAETLVAKLQQSPEYRDCLLTIARPNHSGASVDTSSLGNSPPNRC